MGSHHEEGTARTLVHSEAWFEDGPTSAGFLMRTTLNSPGDKFLGSSGDETGDAFYYSFPPGHPLWAYFAHRAIGLEPSVGSVRVLNLILGLMSAAMIYLIVREMLRALPGAWAGFAGLVSAGLYMFAPGVLWYQSNAYTSGSAVQPFFVLGLLAYVYAYRACDSEDGRWLLGWTLVLGMAVFFMTYTEWLGLAFAGVAALAALVRRSDPVARRLGTAAVAGGGLALLVVVVQYSSALGVLGVFETFAGRYADRSGLVGGAAGYTFWQFEAWSRLAGIYVGALGVPLACLAVLYAWDRWMGRGMPRRFSSGDAPTALVLSMAALPVFVHHMVLFDHTVVHDFDTLKTTVVVSLFAGLLVGRLLARYGTQGQGRLGRPMLAVGTIVGVAMLGSFLMFAHLNDRVTPEPKRLGEAIAEAVEPDEVVWLESPAYVPVSTVTHYSGRNFLLWKGNPTAAAAILERGGGRTGVYLLLDKYLEVQAVGYIGADGVIRNTRQEAKATLE